MTFLEKLRDLLPWKRKGYEVLSTFDSADPSDGDRQVLEQMLAAGANIRLERHVVHYLYFPDDAQRDAAEAALQKIGYETRFGVDYGEALPKSLIAERNGLVNQTVVDEERKLLTGIAEANSGDYDGWEAALD